MIFLIRHILIVLAAMFNAVMDKTKDTIQYDTSVFKNRNPKFWNDEAFEGGFLFGKYKYNAWHVCKTLMLFCVFLSCSLSLFLPLVIYQYNPFIAIFDFCLMGAEWILVFNLCLNKLFKNHLDKTI